MSQLQKKKENFVTCSIDMIRASVLVTFLLFETSTLLQNAAKERELLGCRPSNWVYIVVSLRENTSCSFKQFEQRNLRGLGYRKLSDWLILILSYFWDQTQSTITILEGHDLFFCCVECAEGKRIISWCVCPQLCSCHSFYYLRLCLIQSQPHTPLSNSW